MTELTVHRIISPPLDTCTYLAADAEAGAAIAIDPSCMGDALAQYAADQGWKIEGIVLTHEHIDHIHDAAKMARETGAPVFAHPGAATALRDPLLSGALMLGMDLDPVEAVKPLEDGATLQVGGIAFDLIHAPGHSPGSVCLLGGGHCFTGDVLFRGGVGRWDLPGGDQATLIDSLKRLAEKCPPDTILHPGHGGETTMRRERSENPFLLDWLR